MFLFVCFINFDLYFIRVTETFINNIKAIKHYPHNFKNTPDEIIEPETEATKF
jgi:hypothetical protein